MFFEVLGKVVITFLSCVGLVTLLVLAIKGYLSFKSYE
jgi:hypothetical protein